MLIAYDLGDVSVEAEVLKQHQPKIVKVSESSLASGADRHVSESDALMITTQLVDRALLSRMPRCRIVSRVGTGVDAVDIDTATELGIWVTSVPDYAVAEVSTHTISLLLAHARHLFGGVALGRKGAWSSSSLPRIERLQEQTLGLLGFGRIAQAVAVKAKGLGMHVIAHDPLVSPDVFGKLGVDSVSWLELLKSSDYLSLHVPLTNKTKNVFDEQAMRRMKPTAVVINTARGGLVDEEALMEALTENRLAGAALDVFAVEPPPPDHPLLRDPRVLVTPHMSWYSEASKIDVRARAAEEVARVLEGSTPRCPVNRPLVIRQPS